MLAGALYNPLNSTLDADRTAARLLLKALNDSREDEQQLRREILQKLLPNCNESL